MARPHRDTKGYYRTLGVPPTATDTEIRLAYALLRGSDHAAGNTDDVPVGMTDESTRAYNFLKNPARRQAYDRAETSGFVSPVNVNVKLGDVRVLVVVLVLLAGILGFVWVPLYGSRFRTFSAGDRLVNTAGVEFGKVIQSEEHHAFAGGATAPAFLIEMPGTQELRWFPADDIKSACRKAK